MARTPAKHENATDFGKLSRLILLAKGSRSQKDFAEECGVTAQHLCKCIKKKIIHTPSVAFLKKIASHADNNVQLSDLLSAAGYDVYNMPSSDVPSRYVYKYDEELGELTSVNVAFPPFDAVYGAMIVELSKLFLQDISWTPKYNPEKQNQFSVVFNDTDVPMDAWEFTMIPTTTFDDMDIKSACFLDLISYIDRNIKLSFVTVSLKVFRFLSECKVNSKFPVSVILIDPIPKSVLSERYITASENDLSRYSFEDRFSSIRFAA